MSSPITLVVAPSIPTTERLTLEEHIKEAIRRPEYAIITNYEAAIWEVNVPENSKVLIIAPNVPVAEINSLRERWDKIRAATDATDRVLVVNYELRIDVLSPDEANKESYGDVGVQTDMDDILG